MSFDPTYKGWKRKLVTVFPYQFWSFDPTYKGWKPLKKIIPSVDFFWLWSYLQGMETAIYDDKFVMSCGLWSYLQGMETLDSVFQLERYGARFDPTYKGWKLNSTVDGIDLEKKLWSYLQGMETIKRWR